MLKSRNDRRYCRQSRSSSRYSSKHTLAVRTTVAHNTGDVVLAQFPGQDPASVLRDRSWGFAAQYTAIPRQNMINVFNLGYTRFVQSTSGVEGPVLFMNPLDSLRTSMRAPRSAYADTESCKRSDLARKVSIRSRPAPTSVHPEQHRPCSRLLLRVTDLARPTYWSRCGHPECADRLHPDAYR